MNKTNLILQRILYVVFFLAISNTLHAQFYVNGDFAFVGSITSIGNVEFGPNADVQVYNGSEFFILGTSTVVNVGAKFTAPANPTGKFIYQGSAQQNISGGNSAAIGGAQPSLVNIEINNSNNVVLSNTNTRLTSGIEFTNGHLLLGSQNLELSSDAVVTNANKLSYVVTNGNGFLAKENIAASSTFDFPVGRLDNDFTPASISNTSGSPDNYFVQVKNYGQSASVETVESNGMHRAWNIYSSNGSASTIALQHNSSTNGASYTDANAFVTQYQGMQWVSSAQQNQGVWQIGTGAIGTDAAGTVAGSRVHNRAYASTATNSTANEAFFSKSSNELTPLPITLIEFDANKLGENQSLVTWSTSSEMNSSHFDVQTSVDGEVWMKIGEVKAQGVSYHISNYQFVHTNPIIGYNFYRINMVDLDGSQEYSNIKYVLFGNKMSTLANVVVYPNPSNGILNISSLNKSHNYTLTDMHGKAIQSFNNTTENSDFQVDLNNYSNGIYFIKAESDLGEINVFKIILNK